MTKDILPSDSNDLGRPLFCTHALWAAILDDWQIAKGDSDPWDDIVFDKLAHLILFFWNNLYKKEKVSFKSPYFSAPGIHGPGAALRENGPFLRPLHSIKVIQHIQQSFDKFGPDILLFNLSRRKKYAGKQRFKVSPGRERTYFPVHLSTCMARAFRGRDLEYRDLMVKAFSKLDREEIRSLGTHQTKIETIEAIEYNVFVHLIRDVIGTLERLITTIPVTAKRRQEKSTRFNLQSLKYVLDEIKRKTNTNRQYYEKALSKLQNELRTTSNEVLQLVLPEFEDPNMIWDSQEVSEWREIGQNLSMLLPYLSALKSSTGADRTSNSKSEKHERIILKGEEARDRISLAFNVTLPSTMLPHGKDLQLLRLKGRIFDIFDSLPNLSGKYLKSYRCFKQRSLKQK